MNHLSGLEKADEKPGDQVSFRAPATIFLELYRNLLVNIFLEIYIIYVIYNIYTVFLETLSYLQNFPRTTFILICLRAFK